MTEDSEVMVKEDKENSKSNTTSGRLKSSTTSRSPNGQKKDKTRDIQQMRVVIRHLPPTMTSEQFLEAISPIPDHNDYYFCKSDPSLGVFGFCRSYINFIHSEDMFIFKDKFDSYVFVDTKGNEFPAIVEFAPFQRIPRRRIGVNGQPIAAKKRDNKCGTIEQDSDYIQFLEELEKIKAESNLPSAEVYLEEIEARDKELRANHGVPNISTPLVDFLKQKKEENKRLREERREERRRRQQSEQKRIREEEQQKRSKLLKQKDDNKRHRDLKESEEKGTKSDRSSKRDDERFKIKSRDDERFKIKSRDSDKRDKNDSKSSENSKKYDFKRSDKRSGFLSRSKTKESNETKDTIESTFVVKMVSNSDKHKTHESKVDNTDEPQKSDTCADSKASDSNGRKETVVKEDNKSIETKTERTESFSKTSSDNSNKSDSKRIRNKDRPTREIYRPGAKRGGKETDQTQGNSDSNTSAHKSEHTSGGYKQRVFRPSKK